MYQRFDMTAAGTLAGLLLVFATVGCASSEKSESSSDKAASSDSSRTAQQEQSDSREQSDGRRESTRRRGEASEGTRSGKKKRVTDEQLDDFARISGKIQKVKMRTRKKMENAESREEASQYQKQAQSKVDKIFENEEMSRRQYARIAKRLQRDEELQRRLKRRVEQK